MMQNIIFDIKCTVFYTACSMFVVDLHCRKDSGIKQPISPFHENFDY